MNPENDNRQDLPRFQPEAIRANMRIVEVLNAFGRTRGITPAQVALAWLMNKKPWIVAIPGTTKLSHLEENLRAADIIFTAGEMRELEDAVSAIPVVGSRYNALQIKVQNRFSYRKYETCFYTSIILLLVGCKQRDERVLMVDEQGSFAIGGTVLVDSLGHTYHGDHAYVFYQKPVGARKYPLVFAHGVGSFLRHGKPHPTGVRASRIFSYVAGLVSILSISLVEGTPVEVRRA